MIIAEQLRTGWVVSGFSTEGGQFARQNGCKTFREMVSTAAKMYESAKGDTWNQYFILKVGSERDLYPSYNAVEACGSGINFRVVDLSDEYKVIESILLYGDETY